MTIELRRDLALVADLVPPGSRVLDVGCGDGALLDYLTREKGVDARGIELDPENVRAALARGVSVVQGDADTDLETYPSDGFDMAVLSQTLQATHSPAKVLSELARIAPRLVVSIPNFGHWPIRLEMLIRGRMPVTGALPRPWYETPNIHLCTIRDFAALAEDSGLAVERLITLDRAGRSRSRSNGSLAFVNLMAAEAIFLLERKLTSSVNK